MAFKPTDFFIGLAEFISILLPGALLAGVLLMVDNSMSANTAHMPFYRYLLQDQTNTIAWVALLFASFGFGYFLSSLASGLDTTYDGIRKQFAPYEEDIEKAFKKLKSKHPEADYTAFKTQYLNNRRHQLFALIFKLNPEVKVDLCFEEAKILNLAQGLPVHRSCNVRKWAATVLEASYPSISNEITKTMAASKFFRSMVIVCLTILVLQLFQVLPSQYWLANFLLLLLSFREYIIQRQKAVQNTYQSIVTLSYFQTKQNRP